MNFSEKLKKLRKDKGLTQEELANAIFVSRTLISKYENGSIYPTKENAEKLASFFNVNLSELIDNDDTVQLVLKNNDFANKLNICLSIFLSFITLILSIISFIPFIKVKYYDYSSGIPPILKFYLISPIKLTLKNNNPIVIITLIILCTNLILGIFNLKFKKNKWIKISTYILFVINLVLIFFSIIFVIVYSSNNLYDF